MCFPLNPPPLVPRGSGRTMPLGTLQTTRVYYVYINKCIHSAPLSHQLSHKQSYHLYLVLINFCVMDNEIIIKTVTARIRKPTLQTHHTDPRHNQFQCQCRLHKQIHLLFLLLKCENSLHCKRFSQIYQQKL